MDDNSAYRELFFEETDTYFEQLNADILALEENPKDLDIINSIFRSAHTLKGMAATMGYDSMADLTHHMENVFVLLKEEEIVVTTDVITLILDSLDTLSDIVEDLRADGSGKINVNGLIKKLEAVTNQGEQVISEKDRNGERDTTNKLVPQLSMWDSSDQIVIEEGKRQDFNAFVIAIRVAEDSFMKSARAFMVVNHFETRGELILTEPSIEDLEEGNFDTDFNVLYLTKESKDEVKDSILSINEIEDVVIVDADNQIELSEKVAVEETTEVQENKEDQEEKAEDTQKRQASRPQRQTIRVDIERLDQFMNLVSELVIHRTRLEDISNQSDLPELAEPLQQVERITSDLQNVVLQLRMQPFKVAVQRFPRMIRDIAEELDKEIDLVIEGDDTELDRTVVAELSEPLVHLLRNAADHGIETTKERIAKGKSAAGEIRISAYPEGNRVVLTISDDGKGLDPKVIQESAERKGINTTDLSDDEINELIFHPGFSTKVNVTDVSGRGVGMDVVKQKIMALNGTIELMSELGKGTTFRITLPLTLSIIQSLLVKTGGEVFALPQSVIHTIEPYNKDLASCVHKSMVYNYNGEYIPIISMNDYLGLETETENEPYVLIVLVREQYYAILIDELIEQREIVIKDLGKELENQNDYLGASILGNGEVILIIDLSTICENERGNPQ